MNAEPELFKGRCEHSAWWVLVGPPFDILVEYQVISLCGCSIVLRPQMLDNPE